MICKKKNCCCVFSAILLNITYSLLAQGLVSTKEVTASQQTKRGNVIVVDISGKRAHPEVFSKNENPAGLIALNKIRSEKIFYYAFNKEKIIDSILTKEIFYQPDGEILEVNSYSQGKILSKLQNTYNDKGQLFKSELVYPGGRKGTTQVEQFEYDGYGMESKKYLYNGDTTVLDVYELVYDSSGLCVKVLHQHNNNDSRVLNEFAYDEQQRLIEKRTVLSGTIVYEYIGNPVTIINVYQQIGAKKKKEETYYFNNKLQIEKIEKNSVQVELAPGSLKPIGFRNGKADTVISDYSYNADGSLVQVATYSPQGNSILSRHYYFK
jgi:hypothetical protein